MWKGGFSLAGEHYGGRWVGVRETTSIYHLHLFLESSNHSQGTPDLIGARTTDFIIKKAMEDAGRLPGCKAWLLTVELWVSSFRSSLWGFNELILGKVLTRVPSTKQVLPKANYYYHQQNEHGKATNSAYLQGVELGREGILPLCSALFDYLFIFTICDITFF